MKKYFRVLCLAIAVVLCAGFAACGRFGGGDEPEVVRPEWDTDDYRMNETITVNTALVYNEDWYTGTGFTAQNNPVYDLYKSAVNVNMVNKFALPFEGYSQQITAAHLTGDYPDVFYVTEAMLDELIRNDAIVNLAPYYEQWGTEELKETLEYNDGINFSYSLRDGKLYGIPKVTDDCDRPTVWARTDWITALNARDNSGKTLYDTANNKRFHADGPKSLNEFWALSEAFALEDPDGNGTKDTYGLSISKGLDATTIPIFNAYNCYPTTLEEQDDGTWVNRGLDTAMTKPLKKLAEMVAKNVIDSDYISWSNTDAWSKAASGYAGIVLGPAYLPTWPLSNTIKFGGDWCASPMYQENGELVNPTRMPNVDGYYVVKKGFSNPEVLIKLLNNLATSDENNAWYKGYMAAGETVGTENEIFNWMPVSIDRSTVNFERHTAFMSAIDAYEETGEFDESMIEPRDVPTRWNMVKGYYLDNTFKKGWAMYKTFVEGVTVAKKYGEGVYNEWNYPLSQNGKNILARLERTTDQVRNRIISGKESDIDAAFATYVEDWYAGGGRTLLKEMKDYMAKQRAEA